MKTVTDHHTKMAETLTELSAHPTPESATKRLRFSYKSSLVALTSVLLLAAGMGFALRSENEPAALTLSEKSDARSSSIQPSSIEPIVSASMPFVREITGSGYVVAPYMAVIYAERGGQIADILVVPGDKVTIGQPLLLIRDEKAGFALENAKLALNSAKLTLSDARISWAQTEATLHRQTELSRRGAIASNRLEDAQTAARIAANKVEHAKAEFEKADLAVRIAEDRVTDLIVRAPIPGTVTQLSAHVGDAVLDRVDAIHDGIGLMKIADLDQLVVDADVSEKAISTLSDDLIGEAVLDAYPDHSFPFALQRVSPEVNAAKGTVRLRLKPFDAPRGLRPGMAARIRIALRPSSTHAHSQPGANP